MADEINKKISIEIDINNDGQQQVDQYKAAFDNLRTSFNGKKIDNQADHLCQLA